jgi:hypothetical protein
LPGSGVAPGLGSAEGLALGDAAGLGPPRTGVGVGLAAATGVGDGAADRTGWGSVGDLLGREHAHTKQARARAAQEAAPVQRRAGTA